MFNSLIDIRTMNGASPLLPNACSTAGQQKNFQVLVRHP
jgi:hypothetical protein